MKRRRWLIVAVVAAMVIGASFMGTGTGKPFAGGPQAGAAVTSTTVSGLNSVVAQAIDRAVALSPPECRMTWPMLAGFGEVESHNGEGRAISSTGEVTPWVIGLKLDGVDFALIWDTDGGAWDRDPVYDRAVGLWQFIPGTYRAHAIDANGDGVSSPHNIFDLSASAAHKLCADAGGPIDIEANFRRAAWAYNQSVPYANDVWAAIQRFRAIASSTGGTAAVTGGLRETIGGALLAEPAASRWEAMVIAARADGVNLTAVSSWRSSEEQAALRWRNGCPDLTSPSSTCTLVPTAPVGFSNHQAGLAVDVAQIGRSWEWLAANGPRFGMYSNPALGEPWHWSTTGG